MDDNQTNKPPDLGGLQIPGTSTDAGNNPANPPTSASAETIRQRKTRSDIGKPRGTRAANGSGSVPTISAQQFASLYDAKIWAQALSAPAAAATAITGNKIWELKQDEKDALGATGSIAAQCFAVTDPRWLAASLALVTIINVYGTRLGFYIAEKREAAKKVKEEKKQ